jgi:hypothetical protein
MSVTAFFLEELGFGTTIEPTKVKTGASAWGSSRFSGINSDISTNSCSRIRLTNLAGIGALPGPSMNALSGLQFCDGTEVK